MDTKFEVPSFIQNFLCFLALYNYYSNRTREIVVQLKRKLYLQHAYLGCHKGLQSGISPSYYECDPQLLSKANRRTIAPTKELKILVITVLYHNKIPQFNLSFGLHYSRDTSIQGKQNLVPKKCSHDLCICYLYLRKTSIISGVRDTLCAPKP